MYSKPDHPSLGYEFGSSNNLNLLNFKYVYSKVEEKKGEENVFKFIFGNEVFSSRFWPVQLSRKPMSNPPHDDLYLKRAPVIYDGLFLEFRFWNVARQLVGLKFGNAFFRGIGTSPKWVLSISAERKYSLKGWELVHDFYMSRSLDLKPVSVTISGFWWNIAGVETGWYLRNKKYPAHSVYISFEHYFLIKESTFFEIYKPYSFINKFEIGYQFSLNKLKVRESKVSK